MRALFADLPDKRLLAIKGGINLRLFFHRLFFQSARYSEDLDLEVRILALV